MFKLSCKAQNYAWGKFGEESLVGKIYAKHHAGEDISAKPFAEFWMGGHPNGPSMVKIDSSDATLVKCIGDEEFVKKFDGQTVPLRQLFELDHKKFCGQEYLDKFQGQDPT